MWFCLLWNVCKFIHLLLYYSGQRSWLELRNIDSLLITNNFKRRWTSTKSNSIKSQPNRMWILMQHVKLVDMHSKQAKECKRMNKLILIQIVKILSVIFLASVENSLSIISTCIFTIYWENITKFLFSTRVYFSCWTSRKIQRDKNELSLEKWLQLKLH